MISVRIRLALLPIFLLSRPLGAWAAPPEGAAGAPNRDEARFPGSQDKDAQEHSRTAPDSPESAPKASHAPSTEEEREQVSEVLPEGSGATRFQAAPSQAVPSRPVDLSAATTHTLRNDLEVVLQAIPGAPEVSVCTAIDAGSRLDPVGSPGAYRVLAEILKDGGYVSASQDYAALVVRRGGRNEVSVTRETTTFCTTVPASELPLALWVSAGRFTAGALTEKALQSAVETLAKESEFLDAQVRSGRAPERLRRMAFLGTYEFAHPTLPNPDDLELIQLSLLRELHRDSYVARRTKIAISGGFELENGTKMLSEHLYAARPGLAHSYALPRLVAQTTARFSMEEDQTAKTPAAWYGWVVPAGEKRPALEIALRTLVSEKRLTGQLVGPGRAATALDLSLDLESSEKSYGLARLEIVGSSSNSLGTIEKAFNDQLKSLTTGTLKEEEIIETQRRLLAERAARLATPLGRARELARGVLFGQTPGAVLAPLKEGAQLTEVSVEAVRQAALGLLHERNRSAIEIYPKGWQDPWQEPMRKFHIVSKGETLGSIASRYGTTIPVITKMNGIERTKTIYPGDKLRVPRGPASKEEKKPRTHQVRRGDTLSGLSQKYGVSARAIAEANGMGAKLIIRTGETLEIPWGSGGGQDSTKSGSKAGTSGGNQIPGSGPQVTYEVKSGDTLSQIAARHGVTSVALARENGISHKAMVKVGQVLKLPPRGTGKNTAGATPASAPAPTIAYTVKSGDTLSGIAQKHGVTVAAITSENGMNRKSTLRPGQQLKIPAKK